MYLPKLVFVLLSFLQPENFLMICGAIAVEQFGYGFGFTAFMLYMLYFADGAHKTAHYAICTGFMGVRHDAARHVERLARRYHRV